MGIIYNYPIDLFLDMSLKTLFVIYFTNSVFHNNLKHSKKSYIVITLCFIISKVIISLLWMKSGYFHHYDSFFSIISLLVSMTYLYYTFSTPVSLSLFFLFLLKVYTEQAFFSSKYFQDFIVVGVHDLFFSYILSIAVFLILTLPFFLIIINKYFRPLIGKTFADNYWKYICFIPLGYYFIYLFGITTIYKFDDGLNSFMVSFVWFLCTTFSYYIILQMMNRIIVDTERIQDLEIESLYLSMQQKQFQDITDKIKETKKTQHDFKKHLLALRGYFLEDDRESFEKYFNTYIATMDTNLLHLCDNAALNAILTHYIVSAGSQGINMTYLVDVDGVLSIPETDFCVLLGNLLDNAFEGCGRIAQGEKFIDLKLIKKGRGMIFLTLINSYGGRIKKDGENFISSKWNNPGIGVSTVKKIAEKYNGEVQIDYTDKEFSVSVFLNS